jgi:hypothetical protein
MRFFEEPTRAALLLRAPWRLHETGLSQVTPPPPLGRSRRCAARWSLCARRDVPVRLGCACVVCSR